MSSLNGSSTTYDAVVVGASIAGCSTAVFLARSGARVALIERKPDPGAFKTMCSHYVQSSAIGTLERLGILGTCETAGGVRSRLRIWTLPTSAARRSTEGNTGWILLGKGSDRPPGINLRREKLDPLLRELAGSTPGVDVLLGRRVTGLTRAGRRVTGVVLQDGRVIRGKLVVGADGRDTTVGKLSEARTLSFRNERFTYAAYYEGPAPHGSDSCLWFMDPQWAAALPTDSGLNVYLCMPTKDLLPRFRANPEAALIEYMSSLPDPPPMREQRRVGNVIGKLDMPNALRFPSAPGLALVGDAALTSDPLWGVGCGWAFQSAEWLAESVGPALAGEEGLARGLRRYKLRHLRRLGAHAMMINDYATGRPLNWFERLLFTAAALDQRVAHQMEGFSTRTVGPETLMAPSNLLRATTASLRRWAGVGEPVTIPPAAFGPALAGTTALAATASTNGQHVPEPEHV